MSAKLKSLKQKEQAKGAKNSGRLDCPFCGSIRIGFTDPNQGQLACECQECGAQGPFAGFGKGDWRARAMRLWLKRSSSLPSLPSVQKSPSRKGGAA